MVGVTYTWKGLLVKDITMKKSVLLEKLLENQGRPTMSRLMAVENLLRIPS